MRQKKTGKRRKNKLARRVLTLPLIAVVAFVGWNYLRPLFSDEMITTYESYTAFIGDIETFNSYSATLDVLYSEILSNSRQVTSVKKVYVEANQEVSEGDKLMQLESGDVLKAGINGTVNEIRFSEGDWIWPNVSLIQICDLTHLQVSLSVDEYDISNVSAGEKCYVTVVPLGLNFETEISHVDRVSTASSSVAYYSVTAELNVPENVLPGMTASVSIPAQSITDAVVLEMAAISFDEDETPYVLLQNDGDYEKQPVEIGISDGMNVEILSGVKAGDTVYRVSGEEKAVSSVSLTEIYKKLVGETVIIRDQTENGRGGQRGNNGTPEGMMPPDGSSGFDDITMLDSLKTPSDMVMLDDTKAPEAGNRSAGSKKTDDVTSPNSLLEYQTNDEPSASPEIPLESERRIDFTTDVEKEPVASSDSASLQNQHSARRDEP